MSICETCEWDEKLLLCCPRYPVTGEQVELVLDDEKSVMACLHLDENGRCAIYASRPRGCRLFECDRMRSSTRDMRLSVESMPACFRMLRGDG